MLICRFMINLWWSRRFYKRNKDMDSGSKFSCDLHEAYESGDIKMTRWPFLSFQMTTAESTRKSHRKIWEVFQQRQPHITERNCRVDLWTSQLKIAKGSDRCGERAFFIELFGNHQWQRPDKAVCIAPEKSSPWNKRRLWLRNICKAIAKSWI